MSETEGTDTKPPPTAVTVRAKGGANRKSIRRVLERVANGESMRAACRQEHVNRNRVLRLIESDEALRARYCFSVAARAHGIADDLLGIADGTEDADTFTAGVLRAISDSAPQHVAAVVKALAAQRVQRDRLRFDARRWLASRLLPGVYGAQPHAATAAQVEVRVVFDAPEQTRGVPNEEEVPSTDYEILTD